MTLNIYPEMAMVKSACQACANKPDMLLEIFHIIQANLGYVPVKAYQQIADALNISRADVFGVVTFYHDFNNSKQAANTITLCQSEACQSMGSAKLKTQLEKSYTVKTVYCLGNCALAPSASIGGKTYGRVDKQRLEAIMEAGL
ncbi:MAG: NAD(P)H-dependent oxidoreductase subunit E [Rhizobiales bacterium]|nr:NAD(P)H-dependent oxidoreductase subunit E [Hyphomicrobiales bacterium]NRB13269.1 NAD(P)H-dependent oxidoreductase subunit E [Hyphomicrobiales bacterium]